MDTLAGGKWTTRFLRFAVISTCPVKIKGDAPGPSQTELDLTPFYFSFDTKDKTLAFVIKGALEKGHAICC